MGILLRVGEISGVLVIAGNTLSTPIGTNFWMLPMQANIVPVSCGVEKNVKFATFCGEVPTTEQSEVGLSIALSPFTSEGCSVEREKYPGTPATWYFGE